MQEWPQWWHFEVVLSPHVMERMLERGFSEADLRTMLEDAISHRASVMPGRFCVQTTWQAHPWEVVVEPDGLERLLIVVTAYPIE
jgi:hypothetical protein